MSIRTIKSDNNFPNTVKNRFYENVLLPNEDGCMIWIGHRMEKYAQLKIGNHSILVHRYSYELHIGKIPKGMIVCHKCDNTFCVAPDHLFLGTYKDNAMDMVQKMRNPNNKGERNPTAKLTNSEAEIIRRAKLYGYKRDVLAMTYQVSEKTIQNIWDHQTYKKDETNE